MLGKHLKSRVYASTAASFSYLPIIVGDQNDTTTTNYIFAV